MLAEIKRQTKARADESILLSMAYDIEIASMDEPAAHYILAQVTDQLKAEGLWRDEDKDLTMTEAFPLSQAKTDPRLSDEEFKTLEHGTFLGDSDVTHEDHAAVGTTLHMPEHSGCFRLPLLASPVLHNLMRASPRDLNHQIARRMIEAHYFEDHPEDAHLFTACYFAAKGVEDESHFNVLIEAGLGNVFPHYTFNDYRVERVTLRRRLRILAEGFYSENPAIKRRLKTRPEPDKQTPKTFWSRFNKVWESLTTKQRDALEKVYMTQDPVTKAEAAREFGITIDSLISRLRTAILKFKTEFWELEGITPVRLARSKLAGTITFNGLWRYHTAANKAQLYKIEIKTGIAIKIDWNKLPKSKNLDWKTVARIKAEVIESCPVPYIHDTEYFDGMKPTILSFGKHPGNLADEPASSVDPNIGFRDIE